MRKSPTSRTVARPRQPLRHFRCASCGYGAARHAEPSRCPICGRRDWVERGPHERHTASVFPGVPLS